MLYVYFSVSRLIYNGCGLGPHRLACVIYEGQLGCRRLACVIFDGLASVVVD
jgi:hypothetical protein